MLPSADAQRPRASLGVGFVLRARDLAGLVQGLLVLEARQVDIALRMAMPSDLLVPTGPAPAVTLRRGTDVRDMGPGELRDRISVVFQDYMTYGLSVGIPARRPRPDDPGRAELRPGR